ncbi:hypothetical protein [Saccharospirillum sp.]|uniref:hypothetical protein n=1 Tax=Saccharospirillum sp. TaxID=2033801 RepID=UPI0034A08F40
MKKTWLITAAIPLSSALPAFATTCPTNTAAVNAISASVDFEGLLALNAMLDDVVNSGLLR